MKNLKRILLTSIVVFALLLSVSFAADVKVQINGEIIDFTDSNGAKVEAQTINSRTMVPLRKIFEVLGCQVDWKAATKEIEATKDNRIIKMQIDNKDVSFTINGVQESKTLDQAPIIKDNRTLVPLRFVSEALNMQVGWDASNSTAIIIDYNDLAKVLKDKSSYIYNSLLNTSSISVTKNYYDDADSSLNNTINYSIKSNATGGATEVKVSITGTSDFVKEIENEEWNDFTYKNYGEDTYETSNYVFSKMLGIGKNEKSKVLFSRFNLSSDRVEDIGNYLRIVSEVDDSTLNVETYKKLKEDWNKFAKAFLEGKSKQLSVNDFEYNYIDIDKLFTQRTTSECFTALQLFNRLMFNVSSEYNEMFFEYPDVLYSFSGNENEITIQLLIKNEYKERFEYVISFGK